MARHTWLGIVVLLAISISTAGVLQPTPVFAQAASAEAMAAAKARPDLLGALSKEIGSTPEQASGAAGTLFGVAKSKLEADEFSQIATAVPGMDSLLEAAPAASGGTGALSQLGGGASGLAAAASSFSKLGLSPDMVSKAVPVLTSYVTKSGGSKVGGLLAGALK
jgi:hypothetical protein